MRSTNPKVQPPSNLKRPRLMHQRTNVAMQRNHQIKAPSVVLPAEGRTFNSRGCEACAATLLSTAALPPLPSKWPWRPKLVRRRSFISHLSTSHRPNASSSLGMSLGVTRSMCTCNSQGTPRAKVATLACPPDPPVPCTKVASKTESKRKPFMALQRPFVRGNSTCSNTGKFRDLAKAWLSANFFGVSLVPSGKMVNAYGTSHSR
mmetsp:Transcript_135705/g.338555  ORF Transcript_135705/g.338555 Transcript_135705/m.338555 type:complete len:205 (+) Transcript_135705:236-850(+)